MRLSGPLVVGLLGLTVGCADGAGSAVVYERTQAIVGPSEADDHDRAVVLVEIETESGDTGSCSGVVVAPRAVLTAAHCVAPQALGVGAKFSIFLGNDPRNAEQMALPENHVEVATAAADPDFDLTLLQAGHDVAVLVTRAPLLIRPLAFEPAPPLEDVQSARVVGFGVTDLEHLSAGRRREATVALARYNDRFLELGLSDSAPCVGDSGGPALVKVDGAEALAGIVSFTDSRCGPFSRVSRLAPYRSFLHSMLAESERSDPLNDITASGGCALRPAGPDTSRLPLLAALLACGTRWSRKRRPSVPLRAAAFEAVLLDAQQTNLGLEGRPRQAE